MEIKTILKKLNKEELNIIVEQLEKRVAELEDLVVWQASKREEARKENAGLNKKITILIDKKNFYKRMVEKLMDYEH